MRYPLPDDTAEVLRDRVGNNRNLGLALDKYLQIDSEAGEGTPGNTWGNEWKISDDAKRRHNIPSLNNAPLPTLIGRFRRRHQSLLADFRGRKFEVAQFETVSDYRLVVGFGAEHVLETSICLHRIFGFPIIPGSAVKGVTRARAFWDIAERLKLLAVPDEEAQRRQKRNQKTPLQKLDELLCAGVRKEREILLTALKKLEGEPDPFSSDEAKALDLNGWLTLAHDFYQTFGTTEQQGEVTFFDACPVAVPTLEIDILNPHYGDYYQDKNNQKPPADYHNPVPTFFLTVAKGSRFQFALASRNPGLAQVAESWLRQALGDLGIGGKTAAGYGFMQMG
jgi:CRISPR-associated protein Cmr6